MIRTFPDVITARVVYGAKPITDLQGDQRPMREERAQGEFLIVASVRSLAFLSVHHPSGGGGLSVCRQTQRPKPLRCRPSLA